MLVQKLGVVLDKGQRRRLWLVLVGTLIAGTLETIGIGTIPAFVGLLVDPDWFFSILPGNPFIDWLRRQNNTTLVLFGAGLLGCVFLLKNFYLVALIYAETQLAQGLTASISNRLFHTYLHSPYTFHLQRNPSELIRNLTDDAVYASQFAKASMRLVREGLVLGFIFLLMVFVEPMISLTVFSLLVLASGAFYIAVRRVLVNRGQLCEAHWSRRMQVISHTFGAVKDAKILGRETHFMELFRTEVGGLQCHETFYEVVSSLPRYFLETLAVAAVLPVAAVFVLLGRPLHSMLPVLTLFGVAVMRLVPAITTINAALVDIRYRQSAFDLVCAELKTLEIPIPARSQAPTTPAKRRKLQDAICLEDVHYRYPGAAIEALQGVSLRINVGTTVAFVGTSGAGKSTLIDILLGLLTPTGGQVLVDGRDIQEDLPEWQRQIGYVPQDIYLIDDSIRRNIAFGLPDDQIDDLAVARAAQAAQIDAFVRSLPQALETPVGNDGIRLSGGQRQRIAIARALYHDPSVIVMDEATNALDHETEYELLEAVRALHGTKTLIIAAHRQSTINGCDRLFRFENGQMVPEERMVAAGSSHEDSGYRR